MNHLRMNHQRMIAADDHQMSHQLMITWPFPARTPAWFVGDVPVLNEPPPPPPQLMAVVLPS